MKILILALFMAFPFPSFNIPISIFPNSNNDAISDVAKAITEKTKMPRWEVPSDTTDNINIALNDKDKELDNLNNDED